MRRAAARALHSFVVHGSTVCRTHSCHSSPSGLQPKDGICFMALKPATRSRAWRWGSLPATLKSPCGAEARARARPLALDSSSSQGENPHRARLRKDERELLPGNANVFSCFRQGFVFVFVSAYAYHSLSHLRARTGVSLCRRGDGFAAGTRSRHPTPCFLCHLRALEESSCRSSPPRLSPPLFPKVSSQHVPDTALKSQSSQRGRYRCPCRRRRGR